MTITFRPYETVVCGVISFSTNILSLTGQRMRYDSDCTAHLTGSLSQFPCHGNPVSQLVYRPLPYALLL